MSMKTTGVAGRNAAQLLGRYRGEGPQILNLKVEENVDVLLSLFAEDLETSRLSLTDYDTQVRDDDVGYVRDGSTVSFTGASLTGPVLPGSLEVEETDDAPAVKDLNMDGILYIDGSARKRASGGTFATMASESMVVKIDGGGPQTITFTTEASIAAAVAEINTQLVKGTAVAQGAQNVDIVSDSSGAASSVEVVSVDAGITTKLGISTGEATTVAGSLNYFTGALTLAYPGGYAPSMSPAVASIMGTVAGPWNMAPGDTLIVNTNAGGDETVTFDAGQATYEGQGASFAASASETVQLKIDGGDTQTITFGSGTETDITTYCAKINTQLLGAHAEPSTDSLRGAIGLVNEIKTDYNAHCADATSHTNADTTNTIAAADASDLATAQTLANEIKADFNLHCAALSELEECITLANELKADYNAHCAAASVQSECITLVNELKANYNAHCGALSTLEEAIALANELKADYNAHRVSTSFHSIANTTEDVTSADATDLASAITLANELKADYNGHRTDASEDSHPTDDDTNVVAAANASDLPTLKTLLNEILTDYSAHIASASFHLTADTTNTVSADAVDTAAIHLGDNTSDTTAAADATDLASAYTLANEIKADYNAHRTDVTDECHSTDDDTNTIASADASSLATLVTLVNELKTDLNAHFASDTFHVNADSANAVTSPNPGTAAIHQIPNTTDTTAAADATDLASAYTLVNEIKADYNNHRTDTSDDCHATDDDTNTVTAADATTLDTLITLVTEIKSVYNAHCANTGGSYHSNADAVNTASSDDPQTAAIHEQDDGTNTTAAADASDLASLLTLLTELKADYNSHRTQASVHDANDTTNVVANTDDAVKIISDHYGTDGSVEVVASAGAIVGKLGLVQGETAAGTGDVADINAVTAAEADALIEADTTGLTVTVVEDKLKLTATTSIKINPSSTLEGVLGLSTTLATPSADSSAPLLIDYVRSQAYGGLASGSARIGNLRDSQQLAVYAAAQDQKASVRLSISPIK